MMPMQLDLDIRATLRSGKRRFDMQVQCTSNSQRIAMYGPSGAGWSSRPGSTSIWI